MDYAKRSLEKHFEWKGKIEVTSRIPVQDRNDLSLAYTPGVAAPCLEIQKNPALSFELTRRHNVVAVVTDGSAVLGLGNIGPEAGMPVMEGKCLLFREFAGIDAIPLCIRTNDPDTIVQTVSLLAGSFGGINLEDISAPRCFEIEKRLRECCDIPVFHDDQHGTAIVVGAAMINAAKVVGKKLSDISCVINGAGAAGISIARHLLRLGIGSITLCDRFGIVCEGMEELNPAQKEISLVTNREKKKGTLKDALIGADAFVGVSGPGCLTGDMIRTMNTDPIVFAMANPTPEIMPELAKEAGAAVVGTGRSDYPNQINNLLVFPGIFRGALDCRATDISDDMKIAASEAIAACVSDEKLSRDYIIPNPLDRSIVPAVAKAVKEVAQKTGLARI